MFNVASLKTLKLLDEPSSQPNAARSSRRANVHQIIKKEINDFLYKLENRVRTVG